ncbi:MAG: hypothetical protein KDE27_31765 [Planctomycetes bacterium]|nr:hypothetical protein [Planctomycetota bacterium]
MRKTVLFVLLLGTVGATLIALPSGATEDLRARAPDTIGLTRTIEIRPTDDPPTADPAEPDRVAAEGIAIEVVDEEGNGIPGAVCRFVPASVRVPEEEDVVFVGTTGGDGRLLHCAAARPGDVLLVRKAGFVEERVDAVRDQKVVLVRGHELVVRCVDEDGAPVVGAILAASRRALTGEMSALCDIGGTDDPVYSAESAQSGAATLSGLRGGRFFLAGYKAGYVCDWQGAAPLVDVSGSQRVEYRTAVFHRLYVAAVRFPAGGRLLAHNFRTRGVLGPGPKPRQVPALEQLKEQFPGTVATTVYGFRSDAERVARFVGWHSLTGWVAVAAPFEPLESVRPVEVAASGLVEAKSARVRTVFLGPEGEPQDIRVAYLAGGDGCGVPIDESELERVPKSLRRDLAVRIPASAEERDVPPGSYRLQLTDATLKLLAIDPPDLVTLKAGELSTVTVRLRSNAAHLEPTVVVRGTGEQLRASVLVRVDGRDGQLQSIAPDRDYLRTPGPVVPCGAAVELAIRATGCLDRTLSVVVDASRPHLEIELEPRL